MPRKRMIDPEFWSDEKISKLNPEARLLFIGLWNFADDEGIFKNHPSLLASEIFPYEKNFVEKVEEYLRDIEEQNLIFPYSRDGQGYGIVLNFKKHQSISHPQPSKLPRPSIQNPKYKNAIFRRDNFICGYCKKELRWETKHPQDRPTIDHIIPQIKGGNDLPDNLITACEKCNKGKCDGDVGKFPEYSGNNPGTILPNIIEVNISKDNISKEKSAPQEIYDYYSKTIKQGAKEEAIRNISKRLKEGFTKEDLLGRIDAYKAWLTKERREDKAYYIQANNFFGRAARYKDFEPIKKMVYKKADLGCLKCKGIGSVYIANTSETKVCDCRIVK